MKSQELVTYGFIREEFDVDDTFYVDAMPISLIQLVENYSEPDKWNNPYNIPDLSVSNDNKCVERIHYNGHEWQFITSVQSTTPNIDCVTEWDIKILQSEWVWGFGIMDTNCPHPTKQYGPETFYIWRGNNIFSNSFPDYNSHYRCSCSNMNDNEWNFCTSCGKERPKGVIEKANIRRSDQIKFYNNSFPTNDGVRNIEDGDVITVHLDLTGSFGTFEIILNEKKLNIPWFAIDKNKSWYLLTVLGHDGLKVEMTRSEEFRT